MNLGISILLRVSVTCIFIPLGSLDTIAQVRTSSPAVVNRSVVNEEETAPPLIAQPESDHSNNDESTVIWTQINSQNQIFVRDFNNSLKLFNDLENQIRQEVISIENLKKQDSSLTPKGPFETTEEYRNRAGMAEQRYANLFHDKTSLLYDKREAMLDAFYLNSAFKVIPVFRIENYNADLSNWKLLIKEGVREYAINITIPPNEARNLWEHNSQLDITTWVKLNDTINKLVKITYGPQQDLLLLRELRRQWEETKGPVFVAREDEAQFGGGWSTFVRNNLDPDLPTNNGAKPGTYTVTVRFVVSKDGDISDVVAENDPGYGMAKEAIRVIKKSGRWIPGKQNDRKVPTYKRQPITWIVEQ